MKRTSVIITIAFALLSMCGCAESESRPLLMCDFADARESVTLSIILHGQDGDQRCTICTDECGMLSYSPGFTGEFAEIEFMHDDRDYGAVLQKGKHVKMVIARGNPFFSCDNKECNETCEAIRQIYGKEHFMHTEDCPASYEEKTEQLRRATQKIRQYIANVSDSDLRYRLTRRAERIHNEYSDVIGILRNKGDREEYNRSLVGISLYDDNFYLPSQSVRDLYSSSN